MIDKEGIKLDANALYIAGGADKIYYSSKRRRFIAADPRSDFVCLEEVIHDWKIKSDKIWRNHINEQAYVLKSDLTTPLDEETKIKVRNLKHLPPNYKLYTPEQLFQYQELVEQGYSLRDLEPSLRFEVVSNSGAEYFTIECHPDKIPRLLNRVCKMTSWCRLNMIQTKYKLKDLLEQLQPDFLFNSSETYSSEEVRLMLLLWADKNIAVQMLGPNCNEMQQLTFLTERP